MTRKVGDVLIIEREKKQICEFCGKEEETRPYGKNEKEICFKCAHLPENIEETNKHATALINSVSGVIIN